MLRLAGRAAVTTGVCGGVTFIWREAIICALKSSTCFMRKPCSEAASAVEIPVESAEAPKDSVAVDEEAGVGVAVAEEELGVKTNAAAAAEAAADDATTEANVEAPQNGRRGGRGRL